MTVTKPNVSPPPYVEVDGIFTNIGMACAVLEDSPLREAPEWLKVLNTACEDINDKLNIWAEDPDFLPEESLDDLAMMLAKSGIFTADELAGAAGMETAKPDFKDHPKRRPQYVRAEALTHLTNALAPAVASLKHLAGGEAEAWLAMVEPIYNEAKEALDALPKDLRVMAVQAPAYSIADVAALTNLRGDSRVADALADFQAAISKANKPD